jgi:hypothetical protein
MKRKFYVPYGSTKRLSILVNEVQCAKLEPLGFKVYLAAPGAVCWRRDHVLLWLAREEIPSYQRLFDVIQIIPDLTLPVSFKQKCKQLKRL